MGEIAFPSSSDVVRLTVSLKGPRLSIPHVRMIFDTGAAYVVVTPSLATVLGFDLSIAAKRSLASAHRVDTCPIVVLQEVRVAGELRRDVEALCLPLPPALGAIGLLGNSFLRHYRISLDFNEGWLKLGLPP